MLPKATRDFSPMSPSSDQQKAPASFSSQLGIWQEAGPGHLDPPPRDAAPHEQPSGSRAQRSRSTASLPAVLPLAPAHQQMLELMETARLGSALYLQRPARSHRARRETTRRHPVPGGERRRGLKGGISRRKPKVILSEKGPRQQQRGRLCPAAPPTPAPSTAAAPLCLRDPGIMSVGTGPARAPCALPRPHARTKARAGLGGKEGSEKRLLPRLFTGGLAGHAAGVAALPSLVSPLKLTLVLPGLRAEPACRAVPRHTTVMPALSQHLRHVANAPGR